MKDLVQWELSMSLSELARDGLYKICKFIFYDNYAVGN